MFERWKDLIAQWLSSPDDRRDFNDLLNENAALRIDLASWQKVSAEYEALCHQRQRFIEGLMSPEQPSSPDDRQKFRRSEKQVKGLTLKIANMGARNHSLLGKLGSATRKINKLQRERDELADYQAASIDRFQRIAETSAALNAPVTAYIAIRGIPGTATDETDRIGL